MKTKIPAKRSDSADTAVIYARYSSHNQRDVSIDQQVKAINNFAEQHGLKIISVYADRAISGTTDRRPEFQRMIEDAKSGAFRYVIVYSTDRFARDRFDAITYKKILRDHGIRVLSAVENISDDPSGILLESVLEGLSEYYSRELSQKIRRGLQDNAEKCMVSTSIPFGYKKGPDGKYAIHPEEAPVVREIFDRVLHREPYIDIARDLNARGIKTRKKALWNRSSFKFLENERYMGIYIYGDIRIEGGMPAIVDPETFYAVQAEVARRMNPKDGEVTRRRTENTVYLLTGKAYCDCCNSPMTGKSAFGRHGGRYTYYACRNQMRHACDMKQIPQNKLEWFVAGALKKTAMDDDIISEMADLSLEARKARNETSEINLLRAELTQTESAIANIMRAIEAGIITPDMKDRMAELSAQKEKLKAQIAIFQHNETMEDMTREEIIAAFQLLRENDISNKDFQETLFDMFLSSVRIGKTDIIITMRYQKDGHSTIRLPFNPENIPDVECSHKRNLWSLSELMQTPSDVNSEIYVTLTLYREYIIIQLPRIA